jgi:Conjugative transposon protein TcpC
MLTWRSRLPGRAGSPEEWMRRGLRALVVAVLVVLLLLGLRDVLRPFLAGPPRSQPAAASATYPREAAGAFAARFAMAYLTFDAARPEQRRNALQQYVGPGDASSAGWDGQGRQTAVLALPAGIDVRDGAHALVTVVALVDGNRWLYLAVPVAADGQGLAVSGTPVLLPQPDLAAGAQPAEFVDQDPALSAQLRPYLTAFLRAYAASSQAELSYYAAPAVELTGLGGQVTLAGLDALSVEQPSGTQRSVVASVRWTDSKSGGTLTQRYRLQLAQVNGKWLVAGLGPAA